MHRMMDHRTTEIRTHVQKVLASIFTTKKIIIKETPGNRLTKTHGITMGSTWNTDCAYAMHDCKPRVMMDSIKNVALSDFVPHFFS